MESDARKFIKSVISFSLAMPLFGVKQVLSALSPKGPDQSKDRAASALDSVTEATQAQMGEAIKGVFKGGDKLQRSVVDAVFAALPEEEAPGTGADPEKSPEEKRASQPEPPPLKVDAGRLDRTTFVALGGGLAAGTVDFSVQAYFQKASFPARIAGQMGASFAQPLIQAPGIGQPPGFAALPVLIPADFQTTVRSGPPEPVSNLSAPGLRLSDALRLRPAPPVIHRNDALQTAVNLILGMEEFTRGGDTPPPTQLEYALRRRPTLALLEFGYHHVLEAAAAGDPDLLPAMSAFRSDYAQLLSSLRGAGAEVVVTTVPDPLDTAGFSPIPSAAKVLKVGADLLVKTYDLQPDDRITVPGLVEMGCQMMTGEVAPLPDGAILRADIAGQVSRRVRDLNEALRALAGEHGAHVCDLHGLFREIGEHGVSVGGRTLTADFLGGVYSLSGCYPGPTGHALIANEALRLLNAAYGADFHPVDVERVFRDDPVADYAQAQGPDLQMESLPRPSGPGASAAASALPEAAPEEERTPAPEEEHDAEKPEAPAKRFARIRPEKSSKRLELPPGLEQVLPLDKEASYFGDTIKPVNCRDEADWKYGGTGDLLFGGVAMVDSHLSGQVRVKFTPPVENVTHFEVTHEGGLTGDDGILAAPRFFRLPVRHNQVKDDPNLISSGDLNLETGEVANLNYVVRFFNSALFALVRVNPRFPDVPIQFPGLYGSAWAKFEQRPDGKLDFTFYGTTFVPLGMVPGLDDPIRFPLPFCSPTQQYASIPARGTSLHPHLHLSTRAPEELEDESLRPDIPCNTVQEYTLYSHNTSFGDLFTLDLPELGGTGKGRSHLLGRLVVQFGERSGNTVPIAVSCLNPGGLMADVLRDNPLSEELPGASARMPLLPGPLGHNEFLKFPRQTYFLNRVYQLDDPFDLSVGAVDLRTGRLVNELLHRGLISQNLFFALIRIETRTPKSSFFFRGPARFERGTNGQTVFRFDGEVRVVYPARYKFPAPDLTTHFIVRTESTLDPYFWVQAMHDRPAPDFVKKGGASEVTASTGDRFSYTYAIPGDPSRQEAVFEYVNHSQGGMFRMHTLTWVSFTNSLGSRLKPGNYDTVSFSGYGTWDKDGGQTPHLVSAQVSTSRKSPYVSIQIDGGVVSNVNTKPQNEMEALP